MALRTLGAAVLTLACMLQAAAADLSPEGGVGITTGPDSVRAYPCDYPPGEVCPMDWKTATEDTYAYEYMDGFGYWIDLDLDVLTDSEFDSVTYGEVTDFELWNLADALDNEFQNRFGWLHSDLGLTFEYFHAGPYSLYNPGNPLYQIMLFQHCWDEPSIGLDHINHIDIYLCPQTRDWGWATYPSWTGRALDAEEDFPPEDRDVWNHNSVRTTDHKGNPHPDPAPDETIWPKKVAQTVCHEFTHACWASNACAWGYQYAEGTEYNELFASAAEYLVGPTEGFTPTKDVCYAYSILHGSDPGSNPRGNRYSPWRIFAAYLAYQFHDVGDIRESLLSRWSRHRTERGQGLKLERTFCGLADLMDDDAEYGHLGYCWGGYDGGCRASWTYRDFGIARWVDSDSLSTAYYFGPDYSPWESQGLFRKISNHEDWPWELAVAPEFILGEENLDEWTGYPDPSDPDCPDGWWDHAHDPPIHDHHMCVPIKADLWGNNYLVFRADTTYYTPGWRDTLVVEFDWTGNMNPHVRLWLSVLTYPASRDSLYMHGDELSDVECWSYNSLSPGVVTVRIPDFRKNANEAAVVVLTVTDFWYEVDHPSTHCLTRGTYADPPPPVVDLHYSYRFKVVGVYDTGGGCPHVSSQGSSGDYHVDNNVLAGATAGGADVTDAYLLQHKPEAVDGLYSLRLSEDESERSQFDAVELLVVDHAPNLQVGVLPGGVPGTFSVSAAPVACRDEHGNDLVDLVAASDGRTAVLEGGSWLEVLFPAAGGSRGGGGGAGTRGKPEQKIPPPGGGRADSAPGTLDLTELCYRANMCTSILELPDGLIGEDGAVRMRVTAPTDFEIDHLFLVEFPEEPLAIHRCVLAEANHSESGDCIAAVAHADGAYAELRPGERIDFSFVAPDTGDGVARDFVLLTEGRSLSQRSEADPSDEQMPETFPGIDAYPNPFSSSTCVSFDVPQPGGVVSVRVYDMAGRLVRTLAHEDMQPGLAVLHWDGTDERGERVASGVYFCRMEAPGRTHRGKLLLLK